MRISERGFEGGAAPNEGSGEQGSGAASASVEKKLFYVVSAIGG